MTTAPPSQRIRSLILEIGSTRFTLWAAFILVHLALGLINLYSSSYPMGDVRDVYKGWIDDGISAHFWVGVDTSWVYPIVAIVPMLAAYAFGPEMYASSWLSLVFLLDAVALATLTGWGRNGRNLAAGWWWVGFLILLGPIAMGRIDAISVPIGMIGMLLLAAHPIAASVVITVATWIKVWPAALLAAIVIAVRERGTIIASAVGASIGIVIIAIAFGSGVNVLSFITEQTGRGLQVEAPISTIWLWQAAAGVGDASVYYDRSILTFQVAGDGVDAAGSVMTAILAIAIVAVAALGVRALLRKTPASELLPVLSLAFVTCLILFNKVGSPQYYAWFAVPIVVAIVTGSAIRGKYLLPGALSLALAALTQVIYPYLYNGLLTVNPAMLVVITVRGLVLVVILAWCVRALWLSRGAPAVEVARPVLSTTTI